MRYTGEATIRLSGDESEAVKYISHGRKLMGELLRDKELGEIEQKSRVIRLHGGVVISALTFTGLHQIEIFVPPTVVGGEIEENKYGFRTDASITYLSRTAFFWDPDESTWARWEPDPGELPSGESGAYTTQWFRDNKNEEFCLAFQGRRYDAPRGQRTIYLDGFPLCELPIPNSEIVGISYIQGTLVAVCHYTSFPYTLFISYRKFKKKYVGLDSATDSDYRWKNTTALSPKQFGPLSWNVGFYTTDYLTQTVNFSSDGTRGSGLYTYEECISNCNSYYKTSNYHRYYLRVALSGDWESGVTGTVTYAPSDSSASNSSSSASGDSTSLNPCCTSIASIGYVPGHGACYSCGYGTCYDCSWPCGDPCTTTGCCIYEYCASQESTASSSASSSTSNSSTDTYIIAVDYKDNQEVTARWGDQAGSSSCSYSASTSRSGGTTVLNEEVLSVSVPYPGCGKEDDCLRSVEKSSTVTTTTTGGGSNSSTSVGYQYIGNTEIERFRIELNGSSSFSTTSTSYNHWIDYNCCSASIGCPDDLLDYSTTGSTSRSYCWTQIERQNYLLQFDLRYDTFSYAEWTKTTTGSSLPTTRLYYVTVSPHFGTTRVDLGAGWWYHQYPQNVTPPDCTKTGPNGCGGTNSSSSGGCSGGDCNSPFQMKTYAITSSYMPRQDFTMERNYHGQFLMSLNRVLRDPAQYIWERSKSYGSALNKLDDFSGDPVCASTLTGPCDTYSQKFYLSILPAKFTKKVPRV